jgi:hypothetical protein
MKRLSLLLLLVASPALAQDAPEEPGLIERRIEELLRDLFSELEPGLRELRDTIGDLNQYEAPEVLPNGDIIIRRKTPLEPAPEDEPEIDPDESIEL